MNIMDILLEISQEFHYNYYIYSTDSTIKCIFTEASLACSYKICTVISGQFSNLFH